MAVPADICVDIRHGRSPHRSHVAAAGTGAVHNGMKIATFRISAPTTGEKR
jgi:hypothetical protein